MESNFCKIGNIKSSYILNMIFDLIRKDIKVSLIYYNKTFQSRSGTTIEDIKEITGKYKIVEKKGERKEYLIKDNSLIFEGEYLNGKRNGKGNEYFFKNNAQFKFKGKYLNGYIIEGKAYDVFNNLVLEIKKDGKGKDFFNNGKLQFKGEY